MSAISPSNPLSRDEWYNAILSPSCSPEVLAQIKNQKNEVSKKSFPKKIDKMAQNDQIEAIIQICRQEFEKNNAPRFQINCK